MKVGKNCVKRTGGWHIYTKRKTTPPAGQREKLAPQISLQQLAVAENAEK